VSAPEFPVPDDVVIAMDGPSGSGKSSTSRAVAARLGLRYLDTGAMYRATAHWMLTHGVDVEDATAVAPRAGDPVLEVGTDPGVPAIAVDGVDVAVPIRSAEVTAAVSAVASVPEVRARMVEQQRAIIGAGGIVVEGRDIGSTVAPDADLKVFLTADAEVRALRRAAENHGDPAEAVDAMTVAQYEAAMARRDARDSNRAASPLTQADGAVELDATDLTLEQVVDTILELVHAAVVARPTADSASTS
jgi:cytidylate kinase